MKAKVLRDYVLDLPPLPRLDFAQDEIIKRIDRSISDAILGPVRFSRPGPNLQQVPSAMSKESRLTMEHLRDAMALLHRSDSFSRLDPREIHAKAMHDTYRACVRDLPRDYLPRLSDDHRHDVSPTLRHAFLWGPQGEWTGWPVLEPLLPREIAYRDHARGVPMRGLRRDFSISVSHHDPYGGHLRHSYNHAPSFMRDRIPIRINPDRDGCYRMVCFDTYEDMAAYGSEIAGEPYFTPKDGKLIYKLASVLSAARVDDKAMEFWLKELRTSGRKFGFGVMRDADDCFDPWGVLADACGVEWTWDEDEEGWAAGPGETLFPSPAHVARWLGGEESDKALARLIEIITDLGDQCSTHKDVSDILGSAHGIAREKMRLIRKATEAEFEFVGRIGDFDSPFAEVQEVAYGAPGHRRIMGSFR